MLHESTTRGHIHLPSCEFANAAAFLYLSGNQITQRYETATAYTANLKRHPVC
jgi:hypothetical protein